MGVMVNGQSLVEESSYGEVVFYCAVTARGLANGSSWDNACTFRTAVSKLVSGKQNTIFLGAGIHDTDNGSDATGTTISTDYVRIKGFGESDEIGQSSQLANSDGGATHILRITGSRFSISHVVFDQSAQADKTAIHLNIRGDYSTVRDCLFRQTTGDGSNTGILMDNSKASYTVEGCRFRRLEGSGIEFGAASRFYVNSNVFWQCAKALYASSASATGGIFRDNKYMNCTTAVDLAAAVAQTWYSINATYSNNTTNFADVGSYGGTIYIQNTLESGMHRSIYPATGGVTVSKDGAAWTWGVATYATIIPAGTFNKPIRIESVSIQNWSAAQVYQIELYYGSANPATTSLGIYEVTMGATGGNKVALNLVMSIYVPARAEVGAKIITSTDGADTITFALGIEQL